VFRPLLPDIQREIGRLAIEEELWRLREKGFELEVSDEAVEFLVRRGGHKTLGVRPMRRTIQKFIGDAVRDALKCGMLESELIVISPDNERLALRQNTPCGSFPISPLGNSTVGFR
jgi:ATP-dependent Clp protease ATP-binding subunit ClpA